MDSFVSVILKPLITERATNLKALSNQYVFRVASGATKSYAGTKRQLNQWLYQHMDAQLEFEAQIQKEMAASGDFAEGLAAFAGKRPPRFRGA